MLKADSEVEEAMIIGLKRRCCEGKVAHISGHSIYYRQEGLMR